jgi:hypothetical protein
MRRVRAGETRERYAWNTEDGGGQKSLAALENLNRRRSIAELVKGRKTLIRRKRYGEKQTL